MKIFAWFVAFLAFLLVIAGGWVFSPGSAIIEWPMIGGAFYASFHQILGITTAFLTILLAIFLSWMGADDLIKRAAWTAVGLACLQGVLGDVTLFFHWPVVASVAHACLGQIYFSWMVCLAVFINIPEAVSFGSEETERDARLFRLSAATTGFVLLQLLAGAIYRHTGQMLHFHFLGAFLVFVHIILTSRRIHTEHGNDPLLVYPATAMLSLLGFQLVLGWFSWRQPTLPIITAHMANGALILASSLLITIQMGWRQTVSS